MVTRLVTVFTETLSQVGTLKTLQQIIDNCDTGTSGMDKCHGLIGGVNDHSDSCTIQSPVREDVRGPMDNLPGDNPIYQWGYNVGGSEAE